MTRILLIDDDDAIRDAVEFLLTVSGFVVSTAANGREGLRRYEQHKPDLVITDILMPEMEGVETTLLLRKLDPGVPILAISGGWSGASSDRHLSPLDLVAKLGATEILAKPFGDEELLRTLRRCLAATSSRIEAALAADTALVS